MDEFSRHRAPRRMGRRDRHGACHRRHPVASRHCRLQVDRRRARAGGGYRRSARAGANDCCPAAYGAESCFWRTLRHAGGNSRVLFANARRAALHDGGSLHGGDPRLTDVYWQPDGGGQTARGLAAAPAHLSRTKFRQSVTAGDFYRAGSVSRVTSRRQTAVSGDDRHPTTIRHSHGGPNRWRRYADRHFSA